MAQALSVHGCFKAYLKRFKKRDEEMCYYCDSPVDNAEHALFVCAKWGAAREVYWLHNVYKRFRHFSSSPKKKRKKIESSLNEYQFGLRKEKETKHLTVSWPKISLIVKNKGIKHRNTRIF